MALPFDKKVVVGTLGMLVGVAFWISPELGLLALGGVIFFHPDEQENVLEARNEKNCVR
jgi:hypothetical protein